MKTLDEIKRVLTKHKRELRERYKVKDIGIFGSWVRAEQKKKSDLDILVDFEKPISLLDLVGVEIYLSEILGIKVDVVLKEDIRPELKDSILREAVYL